jgi:peptidoglycan/xylan/chitin deacetylase (PgdA/CDA1 family)
VNRLPRRLVAAAAPALKEACVFMIRWSGLPCLLRNTYGRNKVAIVTYHDPKPGVLERHLRYLSRSYSFVTMDDVVRASHSGDWRSMPPKCLVVTLDDGHRGNVELVDVFRRYGVVPTVFACTQIVGTNRHYWWTSCPAPETLKGVSNEERLRLLGAREGFTQTREYEPEERQALTVEEVRLMSAHVDFGSHTRFHPILPTCTLEEAREEIALSKLEIQRMTGKACKHFSYPNGDYSKREIELLEASGYESARTITPGWNKRNCDLFTLKIIGAPDGGSVNHLAASIVTFFVKALLMRRAGRAPWERVSPPAAEGAR